MDRSGINGFTGELLGPADPGYDRARRLWNEMIDKRPALIARCGSTTDVVAALGHARNEDLETPPMDVAVSGDSVG